MHVTRKLSLRAKLLAGFGVVTALLAVVGLVAIWGSSSQGGAAQKLAAAATSATLAEELKFQSADMNGWQTAYAFDIARGLKGARADSAPSRVAFLRSQAALGALIQKVQPFVNDAVEQQAVAAIQQHANAFATVDKQVWQGYKSGKKASDLAANDLVLGAEVRNYQGISAGVATLVQHEEALKSAAASNVATTQSLVMTLMVVMIVVGVLLAGAIGFLFSRSLVRRVQRVRDGAERVAAGDLTVEVEDNSEDEIGAVTRAFAVMV
ncbi:MAG: HAMP domain-containing protein, partial [Actinobacteria bacterium]|nr:HAMP domain-containing protein [Actinomycetota bacterium]